ncbi:DUF2194 domain-containing protein [Sporolactobacillus shoreae]|uniref:DUF2194 domain-containing protein n=1 Tax=Sporolactobacillus shoreae TaxID=1465501 RepID=A0A4Z0GQ42_9BACL|nr:DUF2194 domain-containing protein [Sporolactobacillus shoreae]
MQLYIVQPEDPEGNKIMKNTMTAMKYAKVSYQVIQPEKIESLKADPYHGIILYGEKPGILHQAALDRFVENGGRLIFANRFYMDSSWYKLMGVTANHNFTTVRGLHFKKMLFPGYPEVPESSNVAVHSSLKIELNRRTTDTLITAQNLPILWTNNYGKGKVLFWNTTAMDDKMSRGMFVQSLGHVFPAFVSGQVGAQTMFIDDFPAPAPDSMLNKKVTGQKMTVKDFYQNDWWPTMKKIAIRDHIKYTTVAIGTYQKIVKPPFPDFSQLDRNAYLYFGWENLSMGGELGIHGFNHQPLLLKSDPVDKSLNYVSWKNEQYMGQSIVALQKLVHQFFPKNKIKVYVPPSDIMNKTGLDALSKYAPNIETVSSNYLGTTADGSLVTEFGYDKQHPKIFMYPRVTSGYWLNVGDQYAMADAAANLGVVSHFVHPDDVLDPTRSGNMNWKQLSQGYANIAGRVRKYYPQIKSMTQTEATTIMKHYFQGKIIATYSKNIIYLSYEGIPVQSSVIVHVEEGKKLDTGKFSFGEVTKLGDALYDVHLSKPEAILQIKGDQR